MGAVAQPLQALSLVVSQPTVHRASTDAPVACHLAHRPTVRNDRQDCLVLCPATLISLIRGSVTNQPK